MTLFSRTNEMSQDVMAVKRQIQLVSTTSSDVPSHRQLLVATVTVTTVWLILFLYSLHNAMPFNPVSLPYEKELRLSQWFPQGWRFFTRDPRDLRILLLDVHGQPLPNLPWPTGHPGNLFGIRRTGRAIGVETGLLMVQVPPKAWKECTTSLQQCVQKLRPIPVTNNTPNPRLCGPLVIGRQQPVPWAWSRSVRPESGPVQVVKVHALCE